MQIQKTLLVIAAMALASSAAALPPPSQKAGSDNKPLFDIVALRKLPPFDAAKAVGLEMKSVVEVVEPPPFGWSVALNFIAKPTVTVHPDVCQVEIGYATSIQGSQPPRLAQVNVETQYRVKPKGTPSPEWDCDHLKGSKGFLRAASIDQALTATRRYEEIISGTSGLPITCASLPRCEQFRVVFRGLRIEDLYGIEEAPCRTVQATCLILAVTDHEKDVGGYHNWVFVIESKDGVPRAVQIRYFNAYI